ncbi:MAG: hypothetical protein V1659_03045 [Candidatus Woesearchaeota archaeon]
MKADSTSKSCRKKLHRKGLMFTMIALVLAGFFIIMLTPYYTLDSSHERELSNAKAAKINQLVDDVPDFSEMSIEIASYDALLALNWLIDNQSLFIPCGRIRDYFVQCLLNSSINISKEENYDCRIRTLHSRIEEIVNITEQLSNAEINFSILSIELSQATPWTLDVSVNISYNISNDYAGWDGIEEVEAQLFVENLPDPKLSYLGETRYIRETDIDEGSWNVDSFKSFIKNQEYRYYSTAPSYLARLCKSSDYADYA